MEDKTRVWFAAWDFKAEASVITDLMRLQPSKVLMAGLPNPRHPSIINRRNLWKFSSPLAEAAPVEDHIEALLSQLEPRADAIATLAQFYGAEVGMGCAIHYRDWTPGIHLLGSVTQRVAKLGLWIDFDLYFHAEWP